MEDRPLRLVFNLVYVCVLGLLEDDRPKTKPVKGRKGSEERLGRKRRALNREEKEDDDGNEQGWGFSPGVWLSVRLVSTSC